MAEISLREYLSELDRLLENNAADDVILHSRHILQSYPKNASAYRALGRALLLNGRSDEAEAALRRVLAVIPDDFAAHVGLSEIYDLKRRGDEAIWHLERALEVKPSDRALVEQMRALIRRYSGVDQSKVPLTAGAVARQAMLNGTYEQAIDTLRNALVRHRNRTDLRLLLAQCLWAGSDPVEAAETAMDVLAVLPDCLAANRIMSELWLRNGRPSDAQAFLNRVQAIDPYIAVEIATSAPVEDDAYHIEHLDVQRIARSEMAAARPDWLQDIRPGSDAPSAAEHSTGSSGSSGLLAGAPPAPTPAFDPGTFDVDFSDLVDNSQGEMPEWMSAATLQVPLAAPESLRSELVPPAQNTPPVDELDDELLTFAQVIAADQESPAPTLDDEDPLEWLSNLDLKQSDESSAPAVVSAQPAQPEPRWMQDAPPPVDDRDRTLIAPGLGLTDHVQKPNFGFSTSELREYENIASAQKDDNDWLEQVSKEQSGVPGPRRGLTAMIGDKRFDNLDNLEQSPAEPEAWMRAFDSMQSGSADTSSVPDWLAEIDATQDSVETASAGAPPPQEASTVLPPDFDWGNFTVPTETEAPPAPEPQATEDWLASLEESAAADEPLAQSPSWLSELLPEAETPEFEAEAPLASSRTEEAALSSIASEIQQRLDDDRNRALDAEFERDMDLILPDVPLLDLDLPDALDLAPAAAPDAPTLTEVPAAQLPTPQPSFGSEEIAPLDAMFEQMEPAQAAALSWLNASPPEDDPLNEPAPALSILDEAAPSASDIDWAHVGDDDDALAGYASDPVYDPGTWLTSETQTPSLDDWLDQVQPEAGQEGEAAVPTLDDELAALFADPEEDAGAQAQESAEAILSEPEYSTSAPQDELDALFTEAAAEPAEDDWLAEINVDQPATSPDFAPEFNEAAEAQASDSQRASADAISTDEINALFGASPALPESAASETLIPAMSDADILALFAPEPVGEMKAPVTESVMPLMSDEEITALFSAPAPLAEDDAAEAESPATSEVDFDTLVAQAGETEEDWAESQPAEAYEQPWEATQPPQPAEAYQQPWETTQPPQPADAYEQPWETTQPPMPADAYEQPWEAAQPPMPAEAYQQPWEAAQPPMPADAYEQPWEAQPSGNWWENEGAVAEADVAPATPIATPPADDWFYDAEAAPEALAAETADAQDWFVDASLAEVTEGAMLTRGLAPGAEPDTSAMLAEQVLEAEASADDAQPDQPAAVPPLDDQPPVSEEDPFADADARDLADFAEGLPATLAGLSLPDDTDSPFESPVDDGQDDDWLNESDEAAAAAEPVTAIADQPEAEAAPAEAAAEISAVSEQPEAAAENSAVSEQPEAAAENSAVAEQPEPETAVNAPDWLNAMVPGLEFDYDIEEDQQLESGFAEPAPQPVLEPVNAVQPEFAWVTALIDAEQHGQDDDLAPVSGRRPAFRFSRRPMWAFTRRPAWSRRAEEHSAAPESGVTTELPQWLR